MASLVSEANYLLDYGSQAQGSWNMKANADPQTKISSLNCARQVVETVPAIMRLIRSGVRERGNALSVPQIRVLSLLSRQPGISVSDVANYLDVTTPTASALIDRLVKRKLAERHDDPTERRRVVLNVTTEGLEVLEDSKSGATQFVAHLLATESQERLGKICEGLELLADAARSFSPEPRSHSNK
jgi:DNA-binding MarR family transcriptional regulator